MKVILILITYKIVAGVEDKLNVDYFYTVCMDLYEYLFLLY